MARKKVKKKSKPQQEESWADSKVFLLLALVFIITQGIGLFVAKQLYAFGAAEAPFTANVNDIENGLYLFGVIIVMTIILVLALRMRRTRKLIWLIEGLAIFSTSLITFSAIYPYNDYLALTLTALVLVVRYGARENILARNLASTLAIIGAGAFIGISLGLVPALAFAIILAVYDIIAVFFTKHMVEIGKEAVRGNYAFMVAMPTQKHKFELGNGDLLIPLMIASSILVNGPFLHNNIVAGWCLVASFIGLVFSIHTVSEWKRAMPALPPQTLLMLIVIAAAFLLGF